MGPLLSPRRRHRCRDALQVGHDLHEISPWLDMRVRPIDDVIGQLEGQTHRRSIKTHLPLDGLPYFPEVRYIVVGRDARDVFMSLWNHYSNYTRGSYDRLNRKPRTGNPLPECPSSARELWGEWISTGWISTRTTSTSWRASSLPMSAREQITPRRSPPRSRPSGGL